jgi:hypothetical protein
MASELRALKDSNTVRVLDLVLLSEVGQLRGAKAGLAVLLAESGVEEIGAAAVPGSTAAVLVWEHNWAAPFGSPVRRSGPAGASGRIPAQAILAAIDADRAAQADGA